MSSIQFYQQHQQWQELYERGPTDSAHPNPRQNRSKSMKVSSMIESKYLKQSDVDDDVTVTVRGLKRVNVARDDEDPDYKWVCKFAEFDKPMVLNSTNIKRMAKALGDDTDDWIGNSVVLYVDPDIEFGGNVVGGLRIKAVKSKAAPANKRHAASGIDESDVPF